MTNISIYVYSKSIFLRFFDQTIHELNGLIQICNNITVIQTTVSSNFRISISEESFKSYQCRDVILYTVSLRSAKLFYDKESGQYLFGIYLAVFFNFWYIVLYGTKQGHQRTLNQYELLQSWITFGNALWVKVQKKFNLVQTIMQPIHIDLFHYFPHFYPTAFCGCKLCAQKIISSSFQDRHFRHFLPNL